MLDVFFLISHDHVDFQHDCRLKTHCFCLKCMDEGNEGLICKNKFVCFNLFS